MKKTARQLQKEQTKELLIKTAYEIFSERGIMNTRMTDIAHAAGVAHGTIFAHFQTQEALIEEVVETYGQKISFRTHALADSCKDLEALLRAHLSGIMEFERFYTRLIIENQLLPSGARDSWISIQASVSFHFSLVYEREFGHDGRSDIPLYMLFNLWMGLVHYYLENGDLFAPEGNVIRRYQDILINSYLKLLTGKGCEK
ncbi:MAG TPA: TetR family transcriptional regulator [Anaerovoracaceae bacterium]|nr:TetR family transcriptional regulator [Anaerovoracaceae bacterium]